MPSSPEGAGPSQVPGHGTRALGLDVPRIPHSEPPLAPGPAGPEAQGGPYSRRPRGTDSSPPAKMRRRRGVPRGVPPGARARHLPAAKAGACPGSNAPARPQGEAEPERPRPNGIPAGPSGPTRPTARRRGGRGKGTPSKKGVPLRGLRATARGPDGDRGHGPREMVRGRLPLRVRSRGDGGRRSGRTYVSLALLSESPAQGGDSDPEGARGILTPRATRPPGHPGAAPPRPGDGAPPRGRFNALVHLHPPRPGRGPGCVAASRPFPPPPRLLEPPQGPQGHGTRVGASKVPEGPRGPEGPRVRARGTPRGDGPDARARGGGA